MSQSASGLAALYLDFDSFFASAEQHLRPELRGQPVGIRPLPSEATSLIAASREAKQFGLKLGTKVREARVICPDITIVDARPDAYVKLHHQILAVIGTVVPIHAVRSIDELVCHLMDNEQARAHDIACTIKHRLAAEIGPVLTCSIGLAPTELVAKIAAEMNKPDGLVVIRRSDLPDALFGLKITDIPGIAAGNAARLQKAGVGTVQALMALPRKQMRALWGNVEGERMHAALHGEEVERPRTERGMFGHSRVLPWNWRSPNRVRACARLLLVKAARRMRREKFLAQSLTLSIRQDDARWSRTKTCLPARDDYSFLTMLDDLLRAALADGVFMRSRTLYVMLSGLVPEAERPGDLLSGPGHDCKKEKWEKLSDISDALSQRYGQGAMTIGVQAKMPGGYVGGKIAFGRIPDPADFDEPLS
ncbi:MAG: Y-family DNA polymerase [Beijerinckiaceae bacterium]